MARIYLRLPQCLSWKICQERPLLYQATFVTCGCLLVVFIVSLLIQVSLHRTVSSSNTPTSPLPTEDEKIDKTLLTYGPAVHYAIVLDCGSSGTRVYVYIWPPHSGNPRDLLNIQQLRDNNNQPIVKKVSPGLDTFADNPQDASDHVRPLLEYASSHIPSSHHKETLLYILATAGMRMLPKDKQDAILSDLQKDIPKDFDFVISENNFEVISGKQEGVYAWIAVNYVLGKFSHGEEDHPLVVVEVPDSDSQKTHIRRRTVGMIDMGGGSMQIAFEVTSKVDEIPKQFLAEFNLGCHNSDFDHNYRVYVTTFLGYGANAARERYEKALVSQSPSRLHKRSVNDVGPVLQMSTATTLRPSRNKTRKMAPLKQVLEPPQLETPYIPDPCLPVGLEIPAPEDSGKIFRGTGDYKACQNALEPLLNLTVPCEEVPCSLNGVYQPFINFHNSEFYGFSEFWYSMEDVYRIGGQYEYDTFQAQSKAFCGNKWAVLQGWYKKNLYPKADENRFRMQCFKAAWMTSMLHRGLKFPQNYKNLQSVQFINNKDVQWTLGALIHRTRYLPLRDIEDFKMSHFKPAWVGASNLFYNEYLILVCFFVVVMAILLYIKRLRICSKSKAVDLSRVPSMSYFMTEEDQLEQGVRFMKNYSYP